MPDEKTSRKQFCARGEVSSAINPPPGCRFHPRCPFAMKICKAKEPEFVLTEPGHYVACHLYTKKS